VIPPSGGPTPPRRDVAMVGRRAYANDHRPATMKVDTDVLSIHRSLLLFVRGLVVRSPESGSTRFLTGSGGPAPSSIRSDRSIRCSINGPKERS
jgi:hypothetical protein